MSDYQIRLPEQLYEALRRQADVQEKTADDLVIEWVSERVVDLERRGSDRDAFEQEVTAFERLQPELLDTHQGQYVAIHGGQVVASGEDRLKLLHEVYEQFGPVVCYIAQVGASAPRTVRIPSVRVVR